MFRSALLPCLHGRGVRARAGPGGRPHRPQRLLPRTGPRREGRRSVPSRRQRAGARATRSRRQSLQEAAAGNQSEEDHRRDRVRPSRTPPYRSPIRIAMAITTMRALRTGATTRGGQWCQAALDPPDGTGRQGDRRLLPWTGRGNSDDAAHLGCTDDPYEVPDEAALSIDTSDIRTEEAVDRIMEHLTERGWWPPR